MVVMLVNDETGETETSTVAAYDNGFPSGTIELLKDSVVADVDSFILDNGLMENSVAGSLGAIKKQASIGWVGDLPKGKWLTRTTG